MRIIKVQAWDEEMKSMYGGEEIEAREDLDAWLSYGELAIYRITNGDYTQLKSRQYTGLEDKNGREIYEGDIIHFALEEYRDGIYVERESKSKVVYMEGGYLLTDGKRHDDLFSVLAVDDECEVIGNIYENPELLEVAE